MYLSSELLECRAKVDEAEAKPTFSLPGFTFVYYSVGFVFRERGNTAMSKGQWKGRER